MDHVKSFVEHLQDAFDDELVADEMGASTAVNDKQPHLPQLRFRPPFNRLPQHDLRGDAQNIVFENMLSRMCPPEIAHTFAVAYVDGMADELKTRKAPFSEDVYNVVDGHPWCKSVVDGEFPFAKRLIKGELPTIELPKSEVILSTDSQRGRRSKQEDRFVAFTTGTVMDPSFEDKVALLAVFDGHGGSECAAYAAGHLAEEWIGVRKEEKNLEKALCETISKLDRRLTVRSEKEDWHGGSTAVLLAVDQTEVVFGWLGDSAGYLMTPTKLEKITRNHSPTDPVEARRVEEAGGQLLFIQGEMRVNGVLNLTRALGDVSGRPMISNEPELKTIKREEDHCLAVLACDGVSEMFSSNELYQLIETYVRDNDADEYYEMAAYVCRQAIERGSNDNVTTVIAFLRSPQEVWTLLKGPESDDDDDDDEDEDTSDDE